MSHGASRLLLYPYLSREWLRHAAGDYEDASCRTDPDFNARSLGLCRPPLRKSLLKKWEAGLRSTGLDVLFFTRTRSAPGIALVAWLPVKNIYPSHREALRRLPKRRSYPPNLVIDRSRCGEGTILRAGKLVPRRQPAKCTCKAYVERIATPYIVFGRGQPGANRADAPCLLRFDELLRTMRNRVENKWPNGISIGGFMQSLQGWGLFIEDHVDIQRLGRRFFGAA